MCLQVQKCRLLKVNSVLLKTFFLHFRQTSSFALANVIHITKLEELKRDLKSSLKTLAMLFVYLLMSCPLYISAAIYSNCLEDGDCRHFGLYVIIFYNVSVSGLIIYPFIWLLLDRQFAACIYKHFNKVRAMVKRRLFAFPW